MLPSAKPAKLTQSTKPRWRLVAPLALTLIAGTAIAEHVSGSNAITVAPGDTGDCATSPCRVTLQMPPGDGSFEVTANEVSLGEYPAGKAVDLGNFFSSQAFAIKGAGVKKAYVYMPADI